MTAATVIALGTALAIVTAIVMAGKAPRGERPAAPTRRRAAR